MSEVLICDRLHETLIKSSIQLAILYQKTLFLHIHLMRFVAQRLFFFYKN